MLGEHGIREDKRLPYTESVHVPILMRWPGHVAAGRVDSRYVLNVDVGATIAAAGGVSGALPNMDGRDLMSNYARSQLFLEGFTGKENVNDVGYPAWRSLLTPAGQYVEWLGPQGGITFREYYETADRYQMNNLMVTNPAKGTTATTPLRVTLNRFGKCKGTSGTAACP
jgi:hypothetical protein